MKKCLLLLLVMTFILALTLSSCNKPEGDGGNTNTEQTPDNQENTENGGNTEGSVVDCNHTYGEPTVEKAASCKDEGIISRVCTKCGYEELIGVPITNVHVEVIDEAVEPTCSTTGLTEGKHCSVCGEIFVTQESIAPLGHTVGDWIVESAPINGSDGYKYKSCIICSIKTEEKILEYVENPGLEYSLVDGECTITGIGSFEGAVLEIPEYIDGCRVTYIAEEAFFSCTSLTGVVIPEGVISIGNYAFDVCSSLTSIVIPEGVTSIGDYAFYACSSLTSVVMPDSVTSIGSSAFSNCSSLTSVVIPEGVTSIGDSAFYECISLISIVIPEGVTSIAKRAFSGCRSLTSIVIPDSVTSIGERAFMDCISLTSIVIPKSVTSIERLAFFGCSSLTSIVISEGVTSIGNSVFYGCSSLTSIVIPKSVTSIGSSAFADCSSLTDVYYAGSEVEWIEISIGGINEYLTDATIHYNHALTE